MRTSLLLQLRALLQAGEPSAEFFDLSLVAALVHDAYPRQKPPPGQAQEVYW
jgi:hypothetical protein